MPSGRCPRGEERNCPFCISSYAFTDPRRRNVALARHIADEHWGLWRALIEMVGEARRAKRMASR